MFAPHHPSKVVIGLVFLASWYLVFFVLLPAGLHPIASFLVPFGVLLVSCVIAFVVARKR
jgi:hypothetical protein